MDITLIPIPVTPEEQYRIRDGHGIVGRGAECDLKLTDSTISRRHAEFRTDGGSLLVKDLTSSNGTFVNGKRVDGEQSLQDGDVVSFGLQSFEVRCQREMCVS